MWQLEGRKNTNTQDEESEGLSWFCLTDNLKVSDKFHSVTPSMNAEKASKETII